MNVFKLVPIYLYWHYSTAIADLFRIERNIFWFLWHFFSIPDTFRTFFSPWERMQERYKKGFDLPDLASTFLVNTLMRIVGMLMRTFLLIFAAVSFFIAFVVCVVFFFVWLAMPLILVMLAFFGISAFFS